MALTRAIRVRGLEVAEKVAALAKLTPDEFGKKELYRAAQNLRTNYGWTDKEKDAEILRCVRLGCNTYQDLANETGWPIEVIKGRAKLLIDAGRLEATTFSSGGPGRKTVLIRENDA